jgi:hypothetical protein
MLCLRRRFGKEEKISLRCGEMNQQDVAVIASKR